jgi:uncharacterized protein YndB with AHSA1/START domain
MVTKNRSALTVTLPSDREICMSYVFDARRALVYEAHTQCKHLVHWWGRRDSTLSVCELDLRAGGAYRFVMRKSGGQEYGFRGVYREVTPPERLVYTFEFEGMPGHVAVGTLVFTEEGGKTRLDSTLLFDTVEDRDGMLQSGMEEGSAETMERLVEYLKSLA